MFLACRIIKSHFVEIKAINFNQKIDLVWADGMLGVCPVYETLEALLETEGKNCQYLEVEKVKNENT